MHFVVIIFDLIMGYLVGSICSAVIVCQLAGLPDPRTEGSKNPGATNVLRIAGKNYAILVLVADMLKGFLPVLLVHLFHADASTTSLTCLAAVVGHMYPAFFEFKGGKGVATALGGMLGIHIFLGILVIATWLLVAYFFRYASLASIIAVVLAPFFSIAILGSPQSLLPLAMISLLVLFRHHENIMRLIVGTEKKLDF